MRKHQPIVVESGSRCVVYPMYRSTSRRYDTCPPDANLMEAHHRSDPENRGLVRHVLTFMPFGNLAIHLCRGPMVLRPDLAIGLPFSEQKADGKWAE